VRGLPPCATNVPCAGSTPAFLLAQLVFPDGHRLVVKSAGNTFVCRCLVPDKQPQIVRVGNALNVRRRPRASVDRYSLCCSTRYSRGPAYARADPLSGEAATRTQNRWTFDSMNPVHGHRCRRILQSQHQVFGRVPSASSPFASEAMPAPYAPTAASETGADSNSYAIFTKAPPQYVEQRWERVGAGFGGLAGYLLNAAVGINHVTSSMPAGPRRRRYLFSAGYHRGFAGRRRVTIFNLANNLGSGRSDLFQAGGLCSHTMGRGLLSLCAGLWRRTSRLSHVHFGRASIIQAASTPMLFLFLWPARRRVTVCTRDGRLASRPCRGFSSPPFDSAGHAEQASPAQCFALAYAPRASLTDPRSELGFRTDKSLLMHDACWTLRASRLGAITIPTVHRPTFHAAV